MPGRETTSPSKLFPVAVMIRSAHGDLRGQILKLTHLGFLTEVPESQLQPGDTVTVSFELGGAGRVSSASGRVVKYYSHWGTRSQKGSVGQASSASPTFESLAGDSMSTQQSTQKPATGSQTPSGKGLTPAGPARIGHLLEIHFVDLPISVVESISTFLRTSSKISRK